MIEVKREYWPNGKLKYEYSYLNEYAHGMHRFWNKDGSLKIKEYWSYGHRITPEEYRKHQLITQLAGIK